MNREAFHRELKEGKIRSCYLFEGEEEFTKQGALRSLRSQVLQGAFSMLNLSTLENPTASELIAHGETLPMMADKRLVVVKDSTLLASRGTAPGPGGDGAEAAHDPASDQDRITDYVERLPDSVCLVFYHRGKASGVRKLYKAINKLGGVVSFDALDQTTLIKWIALELKAHNKVIDHRTAEQLVFAVGNDLPGLHGELQKLAAYAEERREVTMEDVDAVCIKTSEYKVFDLSDAVAGRQPARAARLMEDMLREGEQRLMLLALLQRQYRQLLFTKVLLADGVSQGEIAKTLGVPPFVVRKLQAAVAQEKAADIKQAYDLLVDTEFQVKSGQIPEEGSLERAIYRILAWQEERRGA